MILFMAKFMNIRLQQHITNKTRQIFKYRKYKSTIELIVNALSKDQKTLEKVEN